MSLQHFFLAFRYTKLNRVNLKNYHGKITMENIAKMCLYLYGKMEKRISVFILKEKVAVLVLSPL